MLVAAWAWRVGYPRTSESGVWGVGAMSHDTGAPPESWPLPPVQWLDSAPSGLRRPRGASQARDTVHPSAKV